ncbi:MAG: VasL domain-containing protein, partial [Enterobacter hormaechei]|nr:VasL domain-containing protein [Enterobacter hormaechei]
NTGVSLPGNAVGAAELHLTEPTERCKWVYVVQPEPLPNKELPVPVKQWKPFAAGMLFMLVAAGIVAVGWQTMHAPDSVQTQLTASLTPLPEGLSTAQLQALQQTSPPPEPGISKTHQLLAQLLQLKPDWAVSYGDRLVQQALTLWPEEAKPLAQQWHKQISVAGLAESDLNGWHQGMTQLQQLTNRLNALDEQKGKYCRATPVSSAAKPDRTASSAVDCQLCPAEAPKRIMRLAKNTELTCQQESDFLRKCSRVSGTNRSMLIRLRPKSGRFVSGWRILRSKSLHGLKVLVLK